MDATEHRVAHSDMPQKDRQHLARHIDEERVDAKYLEEGAPLLFPPHVDDDHQQSLQERCQSAGHQYITWAPNPLVERQAIGQEVTGEHQYRADEEEADDLLVDCIRLFHPHSAIEADEHMRHRGDCAQEALRVDRSFVVKMFGTEEGDIDPCQNVRPILL